VAHRRGCGSARAEVRGPPGTCRWRCPKPAPLHSALMSHSETPLLVTQAVILAGGQGSRLRPYTDDRPKPMVEIAGQPIIDHQLAWLAAEGVKHVVVSCGYLADVLITHLKASTLPLEIVPVVESEPLGRGGGLKFSGRHLPDSGAPWYALNGDIWTRFSLRDMADQHVRNGVVATLALARPNIPWGAIETDANGMIVGFMEAPPTPYPINAGVYVFSPEILGLFPERGDHERSTFPMLAQERKLAGFPIAGFWRAIDTAKDITEAAKELAALGAR
jgi:NDP-sugar pyrophosphorylase family protein